MDDRNSKDDCAHLTALYSLLSLKKAALLWCGVSNDEIEKEIENCQKRDAPGRFSHPYFPCVATYCDMLHKAIDDGVLCAVRDNGKGEGEHVAPEKRHITGKAMKEWLQQYFPNEKPAFLFDKVERSTHAAITTEALQALQADRDAKHSEVQRLKKQIEEITTERDALKNCIKKMTDAQADKAETSTEYQTALKMILGMAKDSYGYDPHATRNEATGGKNGIAARLAEHEIEISDDTIRRILKKACSLTN